MIEGTIKIPVTVAMVRALALQADPGLVWPEWMMPDAPAFTVFNKGTTTACDVCGGAGKLALANGGSVGCYNCDEGRVWKDHWACKKNPVKLLVGVRVFSDGGAKVEFGFADMAYALSVIQLSDLFPTLEAAREAVKVRNGEVPNAS